MPLVVSFIATLLVYVKGITVIIITIITTAVKPEDSSPLRIGIKRITVRQQGGLPD